MGESKEVLEEIYEKYGEMIWRIGYGITGRRHLAEEVLGETMLALAERGLSRFRGESALKTYLYRIAVNKSISLLRRERRRITFEVVDSGENNPYRDVEAKLLVEEFVSGLDEVDRAIFVLHFVERLKIKEVARLLGKKEGTVGWRVARMKSKLKEKYGKSF